MVISDSCVSLRLGFLACAYVHFLRDRSRRLEGVGLAFGQECGALLSVSQRPPASSNPKNQRMNDESNPPASYALRIFHSSWEFPAARSSCATNFVKSSRGPSQGSRNGCRKDHTKRLPEGSLSVGVETGRASTRVAMYSCGSARG